MSRIQRIGDLDCLQGLEVPQYIGDASTKVVQTNAGNIGFTDGFGLQTPNMTLQGHQEMFDDPKIERVAQSIRRNILDHFGFWQVHSPEITDDYIDASNERAEYTFILRMPRFWHRDEIEDSVIPYLALIGNSRQQPTYVTTYEEGKRTIENKAIGIDDGDGRWMDEEALAFPNHVHANDYTQFSTFAYANRRVMHGALIRTPKILSGNGQKVYSIADYAHEN